MKLLFCPTCNDVRKLQSHDTACQCGRCHGRYIDDLNAEVNNEAILIGLSNASLADIVFGPSEWRRSNRPITAFVIPDCATVIRRGA